jgi:acyl-CoA thioester hydrolase
VTVTPSQHAPVAESAFSALRTSARRFIFSWQVDFADTDAGGVVYHSRYLEWAERARAAMLRTVGLSNSLLREQDVVFAVHDLRARYHRPAHLDDDLMVITTVQESAGARLTVQQRVKRQESTLVSLDVSLACLTIAGRPRRIPMILTEQLTQS